MAGPDKINLPRTNGVPYQSGRVNLLQTTDAVHANPANRPHANLIHRDNMVGDALNTLIHDFTRYMGKYDTVPEIVSTSESGHATPKDDFGAFLSVAHNADGTLKMSAVLAAAFTIPVRADEAIALDDCAYISGKVGSVYTVGVCASGDVDKLPCAGFVLTDLEAGADGYLLVTPIISGRGSTDYGYNQLVVGTNGKPAWIASGTPTANYPSVGSNLNIFGWGRGEGAFQFAFSPVIHQREEPT